jgi:pyridoxamine 5'-phosphate oxidase
MSIADLRKEYSQSALIEGAMSVDPVKQFSLWFEEALKAEVLEANAMSVSTVSLEGKPSSRILLIKEFDERGFVWFTNYESRKGKELSEQPWAALLFYWPELERQVRIEGSVSKLSDEENDRYFMSRPLGSRLGAHASKQSEVIENREQLELRFEQVKKEYGEAPPRPSCWGGYRLEPTCIEFWQGRPSRLHDRMVYQRNLEGQWKMERLQP